MVLTATNAPTLRQIGIRLGHSCGSSPSLAAWPRSHQHAPDLTMRFGSRGSWVQEARRDADRQLPLAGEIFLDHVAHFVRDPEAASRALERVGFAPTHLSVQINPDPAGGKPQPTGTGNVTAMFSRGYIE